MTNSIKLYKVIPQNNLSRYGNSFNYESYLPKGKKPGKWLPKIPKSQLKLYNKGYHITNYWNMWFEDNTDKVYEVEVKDMQDTSPDSVGIVDKYVCSSIRLVREVTFKFDDNRNTGNWNTGYRNTGDSNTGNWNTGYRNTGDRNTGNWNTGDRNTGHRNTGDRNTGNWNTGYRNTGDSNTGNWNTGNWNTGYRNTGDSNTGNWNAGDWNVGFLNTDKPKVRIFNKETDVLRTDITFPNFFYFELKKDYKKSFKASFNKANKQDVQTLLNLPNFDYKLFEKISGISKSIIDKKLKGGK